jgi:hypothetical protein
LVDAQEKAAITRSVAGAGDLIEQPTLNFNSVGPSGTVEAIAWYAAMRIIEGDM